MAKQYVFTARDKELGTWKDADLKALIGGKGSGLFVMTSIGIPVPTFFSVSTEACTEYHKAGREITPEIQEQIWEALNYIEETSGKKLGDENDPLLVSVRSGARVSMPGMMDTVLNLGLNDKSAEGFVAKTQNERFVYDSYRRFVMMFADVVMGVDKAFFERKLDAYKEEKGYNGDMDMTAADWRVITDMFKDIYAEKKGEPFPQDPKVQLIEAIKAVFRSWENERAVVYRKMYDIPSDWGTAVNVQAMVFGNKGETSGTGVAFTRNPATGEKGIFGEYLINAQGEDVVAGVRTPSPITQLEQDMPETYKEFIDITNRLENHFKDMQDMEFTIEEGKLYFLQTRNGKRTGQAALKIAVDMVEEGLNTKEEALMKVDPILLDQLLHPAFDAEALKNAEAIGEALPASPGAAAGKVCFNAADAKVMGKNDRVILVRLETSPEDIEGMNVAQGILTARGGMTSHAAVVARGMGTCCVSGCKELKINEEAKEFTLNGRTFHEGDYISLDGSTGKIYGEDIKTVDAEISGYFGTFMAWADEVRKLQVRTNADTPADARRAVQFGAQGIGLCRTEHMFFGGERIKNFRKMILADTVE
ncbi:MAG: pyruvate, phosphate dikinase, partial [Clostridia bacterium]|nr:pyruvate, phosphate dikinase [Clostridia bacterium]